MTSDAASERTSVRRSAALDDTDRALIGALRVDGRASVRSLAEQLHISRANAYSRLDRLRRERVITGFAVRIDPQRYGYGVSAYVHVKISQHSWKTVRRHVQHIPAVWHAALVSGENDLVLLVRTQDASALRDLVLDELQTMPDVLSTQTVLIFDELDPGYDEPTG